MLRDPFSPLHYWSKDYLGFNLTRNAFYINIKFNSEFSFTGYVWYFHLENKPKNVTQEQEDEAYPAHWCSTRKSNAPFAALLRECSFLLASAHFSSTTRLSKLMSNYLAERNSEVCHPEYCLLLLHLSPPFTFPDCLSELGCPGWNKDHTTDTVAVKAPGTTVLGADTEASIPT